MFLAKQTKHGNDCLPLVFDFSSSLHPTSLQFLKAASSGKPIALRFALLRISAAIARLLGHLDASNHRRRLQPASEPSFVNSRAFQDFRDEVEVDELPTAVVSDSHNSFNSAQSSSLNEPGPS